MAIPERCSRIAMLLDRVKKYNSIVVNNSFTEDALTEMKDNAKDILDEVKDEVDIMKAEVDNW